jgi:hypothetical protein
MPVRPTTKRPPVDHANGLLRGSADAARAPPPPARITITPYAVRISNRWFGALRFALHGEQLGEDLVLTEFPCRSARDAIARARQYVQFAA